MIESQVRQCYGRVVYSHKAQEKCADILLRRLSQIKVWQILLSAITTAGFIAVIFGEDVLGAVLSTEHVTLIGTVIGAVCSTSLLVLNAYTKDYDLGEMAQKHRRAAVDIWLIREKYLSLITDLRVGLEPIEQIITCRDTLLVELHRIYTGAPGTTYKAYKKAQKALQQCEEMTFSDNEIDGMLPSDFARRV